MIFFFFFFFDFSNRSDGRKTAENAFQYTFIRTIISINRGVFVVVVHGSGGGGGGGACDDELGKRLSSKRDRQTCSGQQ
jgi:hypothetical protein